MSLDEALAQTGIGAKVIRIMQAIFAAATGVVRLRHPDGTMPLSETFDIARGVRLIGCLERFFRMHDLQNPGEAVGVGESTTVMSKFEYADHAGTSTAPRITGKFSCRKAKRQCGCSYGSWMSSQL